jgi:hypothetical protein
LIVAVWEIKFDVQEAVNSYVVGLDGYRLIIIKETCSIGRISCSSIVQMST